MSVPIRSVLVASDLTESSDEVLQAAKQVAAFAGAEALRFVVNVGPNVATIADLAQHLLQDFELSDFAPALRIELASPEGGFVLFPSQLVADVLQPNDLIR